MKEPLLFCRYCRVVTETVEEVPGEGKPGWVCPECGWKRINYTKWHEGFKND